MKQRLILAATSLLAVALLLTAASCSVAAPSAPSAPQGRGASGTLTKIDGNTLTVTTTQGPVTVSVGSNTIIQKVATGTLSDIHEGAFIFASGSQDANGNIMATSIRIQPAGQNTPSAPPARAPGNQGGTNTTRQRAMGTVTKVEGNMVTLNATQGPVTVSISSDTTIQKTDNGNLSDLQEGESLTVMGSRDANNNITATSIRIQPAGQSAPRPTGS